MNKPKRPKIQDLQEMNFSSRVEGLKHLPSQGIAARIDSKLFSLDGNKVFRYKPEVLAAEEYTRCLSLFENRLPTEFALPTPEAAYTLQLNVQAYESAMFVKEMKHLDELKEIAVDTIRELFAIPEHIRLLPNIQLGLEAPEEEEEEPISLSPEEKTAMRDEIQKRIILNALVHGSAMHIWKSSHYIIKDKIDAIDPTLMMLYDQYTTAISWMIWQLSPEQAMAGMEEGGLAQGFNALEFDEPDEPECSISCNGINFPVLLHEITKGAMDYLICNGIPREYTEDQLRYYYEKADDYQNEFWHYLLSPTIWNKLVDAAEVSTQGLPLVIARLTQLSYQELTDVIKACIDNKNIGQVKLKSLGIV